MLIAATFVPGIHQSSMVLQQLPAARLRAGGARLPQRQSKQARRSQKCLQQLLSLCIDVDEAEDTWLARRHSVLETSFPIQASVASQLCPELPKIASGAYPALHGVLFGAYRAVVMSDNAMVATKIG